ncbi:MAG: hypothetical protein P8Z72_02590 [Gammaproteobacteria bacterium]
MVKQSMTLSLALVAGMSLGSLPAVASAHAMPVVVGAFPAPPKGVGPGKLMVLPLRHEHHPYVVKFGRAGTMSGNSFYVASTKNRAYVPSIAGYTDVMDIATGKRIDRFHTLKGGRVAALSKNHKTLFVLSAKRLAAYSAKDGAKRYEIAFGGNAMALNRDGSRLFVGGNMDKTIAEINPMTGLIIRQIPIGHTGDMVFANGYIVSADMKSGVMTAYNPLTEKTYTMATPETDPHFSYHKIPQANAGFMQLAVSPDQKYVYAAGFSGHILRFSTSKPAYLGEVAVDANRSGPNKLSGLTVLDHGKRAISTVENRHESVEVDLSNGRIIKRLKDVASNRWIHART